MNNKQLIEKNTTRFSHVTFHPSALKQAAGVAKRLVAAKDKYVSVSNKTGVPWFVIAVIHEREASQRWDRNIAQGDPWAHRSTHVPKGRGPFASWDDAAYDALVNCGPYASRWSDWTAGGTLTLLELYNGLGYEHHGLASPYIWSGTNQYTSGKYVSDGVFDASVVDTQLGCAALIDEMAELDPSIAYATPPLPTPVPAPQPVPAPEPPLTPEEETSTSAPKAGPTGDATQPPDAKPASRSTTIWASIAGVLSTIGGALTDWHLLAVLAVVLVFGYIIWERNNKPDITGWFR